MGKKQEVKIWCDAEGDYLEVAFDDESLGSFCATNNDAVMEMVDENGKIVGFSVMAVSALSKSNPISAHLYGIAA